MSHPHTRTCCGIGARLIGVALGLTLALALCAGVVFGHHYYPHRGYRHLWAFSLLSPAALAATPPNCAACTNTSSIACFNGCSYDGIIYYFRDGYWFAYDGTHWYCYYDGCWQIW